MRTLQDYFLKCGYNPGAFPAVDFGVKASCADVRKSFEVQRNYSKGGECTFSTFAL